MYRNYTIAVISGLLLSLAFPRYDLWWLAWVALVPFFWALDEAKNIRSAALTGLIFGLTFFALNLTWVFFLFRFGGWWVVTGWVCFALFQALFLILFSTLYFQLATFKSRLPKSFLLAIIWIAAEWLRAWGVFGVTVGNVGYTQASWLPLIQIASFSTVYGVSFLVVLFNAALMRYLKQRRDWLPLAGAIGLIILALIYGQITLIQQSAYKFRGKALSLALVQPNVDQKDKLNPALVVPVYDLHEELTLQAAQEGAEIVVWPESCVFTYLLNDSRLWPRFKKLALDNKLWLIAGIPVYDGNGVIYNSIIAFSPSGEVTSRYDKERLVPFGEYLPFRPLLYPLLKATGYYDDNFDPNPESKPIKAGQINFAPAICFESTFSNTIRNRVKADSDLILVVTNDAWFGDSSAAYFHLQAGVFRAIENRKYFVQVGNTGFSAVIDPYGRFLTKSRLNQKELLFFRGRI